MMKRLALTLCLILGLAGLNGSSQGGVSCSLPFNLQNNTTADATQVMANYNALVVCLASAAAAGANNDITSLSALSTPISIAQGGTPVYVGGTSTGSANLQVVGSVSPATFSLTAGKQVTFIAGFTNTGATTLNVAGTGATNVFRRTQLGVSATVGGEMIVGHQVTVIYDGTQFQIISIDPAKVGALEDWAGTTAPPGWAFVDGSCQLRAGQFADLFSVVGTAYDPTGSTCDVNHFALPDGRGRMFAGRDNMTTAANRITNTTGGSGCNGTTLGGAGCGNQVRALSQANLPVVNLSNGNAGGSISLALSDTSTDITEPNGGAGHSHGYNTGSSNATGTGSGTSFFNTTTSATTDKAVTGITVAVHSGTVTGTVTSPLNPVVGGQTNTIVLNPIQIVNKIIKY